ncbi:MAG: Secretion system C-terminal sorting domain [Bacteroidota bacterium]
MSIILAQLISELKSIKYLNFNNFLSEPCNYLAEDNVYQPQKINLYPNPAYNHIFFELKQIEGWKNEKMSFEIYNINGQIVQKQQLSSILEQYDIDISMLENGFYIVKITDKIKYFTLPNL